MWGRISKLSFKETVDWILNHKQGVVMCITLNEMMMAGENEEVRSALMRADILTPDGMPLVWYLKWKHGKGERVYGPELLNKFIIDHLSLNHLFIGDKKNRDYFEKIGDYLELPYTDKFDYKKIASKINKTKADIVWIGLGAQKQILMAVGLRKNGVNKILITVGAAFDFISGIKKQCPKLIRNLGGEWVYRLISEPGRLGGRYINIGIYLVNRLLPDLVGRKLKSLRS